METVLQKYQEITNKLIKTRFWLIFTDLLINLFDSLFFGIITLFISILVEFFLNGDVGFRTTLFTLTLIIPLIIFFAFATPTLLKIFSKNRRIHLDRLAFEIGKFYPDVKDSFSNTYQLLSLADNFQGISKTFIYIASENIFDKVKNYDFTVVYNKSGLKKSILRLSIALLLSISFLLIFSNSLGYAFYRIVNFNKSFIPPAPYSLIIYPKYETVKKGENVKIVVKSIGTPPQSVFLKLKELQQNDYENISLQLDSGNVYVYQIPSIKNSIKFFAESEWYSEKITSDIGEINVVEYPLIKSFEGTVVFPSYTNKPPFTFTEQNADLVVLPGSRINFSILSNKKLKEAKVVLLNEYYQGDKRLVDTNEISLKIFEQKASGSFIASSSGYYYVQLKDYDNLEIPNPILYKINLIEDEYPQIKLLEPEYDVKLSESALLPMMIYIYDDFGFSNLFLHYRLKSSPYAEPWENFKNIEIPFTREKNEENIAYLWDLNKLQISPEDEYEFYLQVFDNDIVTGPKSERTQTLRVKLPPLEEALKETSEKQQSISKELENALKKANELKKEMENINRELNKKENKTQLDWQEKKKVEDFINKQKELTNKLSEIQKNLEDLTKKMTEQNLLSPETLQKYLELQKLLKEVNSPELERLQKQMEQALQKLSPDDIKKALENYKFDEEQFRKNIERTIKILKRLQVEQKVDALHKLAEELARKQEDLQKQTENTNPNNKSKLEELAKEQENLKKELNAVKKELENLKNLMKEIGNDMPLNELEKVEQELSPSETTQDMEDSKNAMESGNTSKSSKSQEKAKNRLKKFAEQMKKVKEEINNRVTKEVIRKLEKALNDLLSLSKEQSDLKKQTESTDYNSSKIAEQALQQSSIAEAIIDLANSLFELSQKSFSITPEMARLLGEALNFMQKATENLANRNLSGAKQFQDQAIQALNRTSIQIQNMLSQLQNQGACDNPGGMGQNGKGNSFNFMQRLQQIASSQQMINQMSQQLANENQGQLSQEQQAQLARIIADQGRAQKALEELSREQKQFGQTDQRVLGSLNRIIQEMQEVISDLKSGKLTTETLKRQERILSRLLDATKSVYERDYEERRESTPGKELSKTPPPELDLKQINKKSIEQFLNEIKLLYSKDYEEIIRLYFNLIRNSKLQYQQ